MFALGALFIIPTLSACSSKTTTDGAPDAARAHTSPYPTCDAIIKQCHQFDVGEGPIHDCHEVGHDAKSDAPCVAKREECMRICVPEADAGTDASDASSD